MSSHGPAEEISCRSVTARQRNAPGQRAAERVAGARSLSYGAAGGGPLASVSPSTTTGGSAMVQRPNVRTVLALATLSAFGLVAASCGGGGGGSSSGTTQATSAPTVGGSAAPGGSSGGGTEAPTSAAAPTPTPGGSLV